MIRADALKLLQETAQLAQAAKVLDIGGDGRQALVQINGDLETIPVPPKPRNHRVFTLDDLIAFAKLQPAPMIFHGPTAVVLLADSTDRRDVVTFPLTFSKPFARLLALDKQPTACDQRPFCRLLQFELGVNKAVVAPFRNLDWSTQVAVRGETAPGKDRLGREVLSQVKGTSELPEEIVIVTPVYIRAGRTGTGLGPLCDRVGRRHATPGTDPVPE